MLRAPQEIRTFFVTSVTANRRRLFQVEANANLLLDVLEQNRSKDRFQIHAFVVMPDHIHLLLTPAKDVSLEKAMQFIKGGFSFQLKSKLGVWQESYNEQRIKDATDFIQPNLHRVKSTSYPLGCPSDGVPFLQRLSTQRHRPCTSPSSVVEDGKPPAFRLARALAFAVPR